jgi:hypothetical protein
MGETRAEKVIVEDVAAVTGNICELIDATRPGSVTTWSPVYTTSGLASPQRKHPS